MQRTSRWFLFLFVGSWTLISGCAAIPEITHQPQFHNPFPQLHRVAVLPFFNLSNDPTVDQDRFAMAYFNELQQIPGFEVVPVGVTKKAMQELQINPGDPEQLRKLARNLGVDAIVVGAVTDYSAFYPPRLGLKVNWFATNPCFHPIPVGYGLPWGTAEEEFIPDALVHEAEFELAREQLKTQTPLAPHLHEHPQEMPEPEGEEMPEPAENRQAAFLEEKSILTEKGTAEERSAEESQGETDDSSILVPAPKPDLPENWPDPRGFVPPPPSAEVPDCIPNNGPIISHVKLYNGHDSDFTTALANYYYFRDEARFGGWQGYLQRSEDFIRFCCYQHITEMIAARGGVGETRVVLRWPVGR